MACRQSLAGEGAAMMRDPKVEDAPKNKSWMGVDQARAAYPDFFSAEGRPPGELEALLDFLAEMDAIVAPMPEADSCLGTERPLPE